jgi:hypothetical protein
MSAFVVDLSTMQKVVHGICGQWTVESPIRGLVFLSEWFLGERVNTHKAATRLGRRLFTLNIEAVMQAYPDCQDNPMNLPGPHGIFKDAQSFEAGVVPIIATVDRAARCFDAIETLAYQCSEGDVVYSPDFKALKVWEERMGFALLVKQHGMERVRIHPVTRNPIVFGTRYDSVNRAIASTVPGFKKESH